MKKVVAIVLILCMALSLASCSDYHTDLEDYSEDVAELMAQEFMPKLDELDDYTGIAYLFKEYNSIFATYSMQLIVKYDNEAFQREKTRLETAYKYVDHPQKFDLDEKYYTLPDAEFETNGYNFKVAQFADTDFPKNFGMVGISESKKQIAYLWFYDWDLDYISGGSGNGIAMKEFVDKHFKLD